MIIGFHYHIPIQIGQDGNYSTQSFYGLFLDALARQCEELIVFTYEPVKSELPLINYTLTATNIKLVSLGLHNALPFRMFRFISVYNCIRDYLSKVDVFVVRSPTPLAPVFQRFINKKPVVLYLVGDYVESGRALTGWGIKTMLIKGLGYWVNGSQRAIAKDNLVMSNSQLLVNEYSAIARKAALVKSTTLSKQDLFYRTDTCASAPIKILYTGRLEPMKGLFEIFEACEQLAQEGVDLELHLAGLPVKGWENLPEMLRTKAEQSSFKGRFKYHGVKKVGDELNQLYRSADIYIIASKSFEGFPRTVWEAMANGLPVIATKVGSIPYFLVDGQDAVLIEPASVPQIKEAITRVISDAHTRKNLIRAGYKLAEENTLDIQAKKMELILDEFLKSNE